jgi:SHS2 domain-containing protein
MRYKFLEHTADVYIESYGTSIEEAFENAALAFFEVMTDTNKVDPHLEEIVEIKEDDMKALLYSWIEELLLKFDIDRMIYSKFHVEQINTVNGKYTLKARIWGESFNERKHPPRTEVKAITYHMMEISKRCNKIEIRFILDI